MTPGRARLAPMSDASPRFLTLADVGEVLNVTVRQVYALVRSGELRGIQIGGRNQWRVEKDQLEDYIQRFLGGAVDHLRRTYRQDAINLLGVCQGGAFSLCYAALNPKKVRNLVTMVTPVDFHGDDNMLSNWVRCLDVDAFVDTLGNVPADLMNWTYLTLKPWRLFVQKYVGMVDILDNKQALEDFLRMEKWIFDSPDQAGEAFRQFVRAFFKENRLVRGGLAIGGLPVDPRAIRCPVLNVYATQDHLVPPSASRPLAGLTGSADYDEFAFDGGHIGIYVSRSAQELLPRTIAQWLGSR